MLVLLPVARSNRPKSRGLRVYGKLLDEDVTLMTAGYYSETGTDVLMKDFSTAHHDPTA